MANQLDRASTSADTGSERVPQATFSRRRFQANAFALHAAMMLALFLAQSLLGQEATDQVVDADSTKPSIQFRRTLIPIENIKVRGLVPVTAKRFEELTAVLRPPRDAVPSSQIESATYEARLVAGTLTGGTAELIVSNRSSKATLLPLQPCTLSIRNANWSNIDLTGSEPAIVGSSPDQNMVAVLNSEDESASENDNDATRLFNSPRKRRLTFDWQLSGNQTENSSRFDLRFPASVKNVVEIVVPSDLRVIADSGMVSKEPESIGWNRWTISAGSKTTIALEITPDRANDESNFAIYRQRNRIELSRRGVNSTIVMPFEIFEGRTDKLTIKLDPKTRLQSAELDGEPIRWTRTRFREEAIVSFRPALEPGPHTLRLKCTAAAPEINADWDLPNIYIKDMQWQQGASVLSIIDPLQVSDLQLSDCRQVASVEIAAATKRHQIELEHHRRDASVRMRVVNGSTRVNARVGTLVSVGGETPATADVTATLRATSGERFEVTGQIEPGWNIDSLASLPANSIEEWIVPAATEGKRRLQIRLRRPLSPDQPITFFFSATRDDGDRLTQVSGKQFQVLRLDNVVSPPELFAIRSANGSQLRQTQGHDAVAIQRELMDENERTVVQTSPGDLVFRESPGMSDLKIVSVEGAPAWNAEIESRTTISSDAITELVSIECSAEGPLPENIILQVWPENETEFEWSVHRSGFDSTRFYDNGSVEEERVINPRLLSRDERNARGFPIDVSVYEFEPTSNAGDLVRFVGRRQYALRGTTDSETLNAVVASAPLSDKQRSVASIAMPLAIRKDTAINCNLPRVPNHHNDDAPAFASAPADSFLVDTTNLTTNTIAISRSALPVKAKSAWIQSAHTTAHLLASGQTRFVTEYQIVNQGEDSIAFQFPVDTQFQTATIDGIAANSTFSDLELVCALPADENTVTLTLEYSRSELPTGSLGSLDQFEWTPLESDVTDLSHTLSLVVPNQHKTVAHPSQTGSVHNQPATKELLARAFGPLVRNGLNHPGRTQLPAELFAKPGVISDPDNRTTTYAINASPIRVTVYHAERSYLLGWGAFLFAALIVHAFRYPQRNVLGLVAIATIFLILVSSPWVPLARGIVWGSLLGLAWRSLPRPQRKDTGGSVVVYRQGQVAKVLMLLIGIGLVSNRVSRGQTEEPATQKIHEVIVPINEDGEPDSPFVHVPEAMFEQLVRLSQKNVAATEKWIIQSVSYAARMTSPAGRSATVNQLDIAVRLHTFRRGMNVRIPFSTAIDAARIDKVDPLRLDGEPVAWTVSDDRSALNFTVPQPGSHTLRFTYEANPIRDGLQEEIAIPIIQTTDSRVDFSTDRTDVQTQLVTNLAESPLSGERATVDIGCVTTASLRWQENASRELIRSVHQTGWLTVLPGLSIYELRFTPSENDNVPDPLDRVRVAFDSRLRLLPTTTRTALDFGTVTSIESTANRRVVEVQRNAMSTGLGLRFALTQGSGIGKITVPEIEILNAEVDSEWFANSIASSLAYDEDYDGFSAVSLAEFANRWGAPNDVPDFVVQREKSRVPAPGERAPGERENGQVEPWSLRSYAKQSRSEVDWFLTATYGNRLVDLTFQADVTPIEGTQFKYTIEAPSGMDIQRFTIKADDDLLPTRWTQDADGTIHAFVLNPTPGARQIIIEGSLSHSGLDAPTRVPDFRVSDATIGEATISLRKRPDANVTVLDAREWQQVSIKPQIEMLDSLPVARFIGDGDFLGPVRLKLNANRPQVAATVVTRITREDATWWNNVDCRFQFKGGIPHVLRFDIPTGWGRGNASIELTPDVEWEFAPSANGDWQLQVFPETAAGQTTPDVPIEWRLAIRGQQEPNLRAAMPEVIPLGMASLERWVVLPTEVDGNRVGWNLRGTEKADLPNGFRLSENQQSFRLNSEQASAELRRIEAPAKQPKVLAGVIEVNCDESRYSGTATWNIQPNGSRATSVFIPQGCRLIAAQLDGVPIRVPQPAVGEKAEEESQLQVDLGGLRLSQQLEVTFAGELRGKPRELAAPRLVTNSDFVRLWRLTRPQFSSSAAASVSMLRLTELASGEFGQAVAEAHFAALQATDDDPGAYSQSELATWFQEWRARIQAVANKYPAVSLANPALNGVPADGNLDSVPQLTAIAEKLDITNEIASRDRVSPFPTGDFTADAANVEQHYFTSQSEVLQFVAPQLRKQFFQKSLLVALIVIIAFVVAFLAPKSSTLIALPSIGRMQMEWYDVALLILGFVWACALKLPALGILLIVVVCYALYLRRGAAETDAGQDADAIPASTIRFQNE